ncbi:CpsD/CapB family tyrosine-protein kinase [Bacillus sp. DJP31]|uniref:CpsD/CapB family tyrosine-protein kinase n=1 Tax=Bacillus sp. DJP31 TaxID=3409789 RepID=UPI003BB64346
MIPRGKSSKTRNIQLVANINPKSPITEQYRLIRNNISFSSVDKVIKSIVVTSAESGDGKSTTAANLAIVLAQNGRKVLLVDGDLRRPTLHYAFFISNIDGITSVLTKDSSLEMAINRTTISNLDILPSGPIPPNPSELLDSQAMNMLMEELKESYDYVIYDSPPILAVTDSQTIASKCDGVVMVIRSGKTHKIRALKAKELLEKAGSQVLGVVINGVEEKMSGYYGHYG